MHAASPNPRRVLQAAAPILGLILGLGLVLARAPASADESPARGTSTSRAPTSSGTATASWRRVPMSLAVHRGIKWLVINQGADGGWGQEGARAAGKGRRGPTQSDIGNTCVAMMAIMAEGSRPNRGVFQAPLHRGASFLLQQYEHTRGKDLDFGRAHASQLRGKIGRYAETFLATRVFLEVDGHMRDAGENRRVRTAIVDLIARIQKHQAADGSWNTAQGWAPIHGTAYASQALQRAREKGLKVDPSVLAKVDRFTVRQLREQVRTARGTPAPPRRGGRKPPVVTPGSGGTDLGPITLGGAGVQLYCLSQAYEQFTRTPASRKRFAGELAQIQTKVSTPAVMRGFGSMGGEEFISYTNIAVGMARLGTKDARAWIERTRTAMEKLQNRDGSWSGHHCITGRTAVTSLAVQTLMAERQAPRPTR